MVSMLPAQWSSTRERCVPSRGRSQEDDSCPPVLCVWKADRSHPTKLSESS